MKLRHQTKIHMPILKKKISKYNVKQKKKPLYNLLALVEAFQFNLQVYMQS